MQIKMKETFIYCVCFVACIVTYIHGRVIGMETIYQPVTSQISAADILEFDAPAVRPAPHVSTKRRRTIYQPNVLETEHHHSSFWRVISQNDNMQNTSHSNIFCGGGGGSGGGGGGSISKNTYVVKSASGGYFTHHKK